MTEQAFERREENEWLLARTQYTKAFLTPDFELSFQDPDIQHPIDVSFTAEGEKPSEDHSAL